MALLRILKNKRNSERGFSLLEYCAGAAVLLVTVWVALNRMGTNVSTLLDAIGSWASDRATAIHPDGGQGQP